MDKNNNAIIKPSVNEPSVIEKLILYPYYLSEVVIRIPRAIGRPRMFKLFLLVDGCTGKVLRCDSWPRLQRADSVYEYVSVKINSEEAKLYMIDYARKKIVRRYMTYWKSSIEITRFRGVYKIFWMTDPTCAVDSLSAHRLTFS
ncbi:MAG TPA: hypothetical protein VK029_00370 [Pseudogracilibacillus sp.]|nr:hypothetical protein [Pseudogracilibacillus sp.]